MQSVLVNQPHAVSVPAHIILRLYLDELDHQNVGQCTYNIVCMTFIFFTLTEDKERHGFCNIYARFLKFSLPFNNAEKHILWRGFFVPKGPPPWSYQLHLLTLICFFNKAQCGFQKKKKEVAS